LRVPESSIPFAVPFRAPRELEYIQESLDSGLTSGDGPFTSRASELLRARVGGGAALLTTSCTHALEMSVLLLDLGPGDEVIVPSFTFVSSVNAIVLRGAVPVFVDIRPDTLNLDEMLVESAITPRTRAIMVVHYGGVACEMDTIMDIAEVHGLQVIEDNAHGLDARYRGRQLGSIGTLSTLSFHATKNISCGEGGALVINEPSLLERAEIIREKGTNRSQFQRGEVNKYRWIDVGSSYLSSDILAAVLCAQLESFDDIQERRQRIWSTYDAELEAWSVRIGAQKPHVPDECEHPAHLYSLLLPTAADRDRFIAHLGRRSITAPFHYVPLHTAPAADRFGRTGPGGCPVTEDLASRLVRLPLFASLTSAGLERVIAAVLDYEPRT
jgi:dTDP-4-amino-4,6-dideoxygalactose transaminase